MVGKWLLRGMFAGIVAGLLTFCFARVVGEPQVDKAISFEQNSEQGHSHGDETELVSRPTQAGAGLLTGVVVYGAAIGGLFSLVMAYAYGRVSRMDPRGLAGVLALIAFVVLVVVPGLKYPPNPPAVGDPETIGMRTGFYFVMLAASTAVAVFASSLRRALLGRIGAWNATLAGCAVYVVLIALVALALPVVNEVPATFPAVVLWKFRMAAWGMQAVMWTSIGLIFGSLAKRSLKAEEGMRGRTLHGTA